MGKGNSFQQMVLRSLDVHLQKMKLDPSLIQYRKINTERIKAKLKH